jgi:hypothetical protein
MLYTTQTEPFEFHYTTKEALIQWAEYLSVWIPIAHSKFPYQKTKRKAKTNDVDSYVNDVPCSPQAVTKLPPLRPPRTTRSYSLSLALSLSQQWILTFASFSTCFSSPLFSSCKLGFVLSLSNIHLDICMYISKIWLWI